MKNMHRSTVEVIVMAAGAAALECHGFDAMLHLMVAAGLTGKRLVVQQTAGTPSAGGLTWMRSNAELLTLAPDAVVRVGRALSALRSCGRTVVAPEWLMHLPRVGEGARGDALLEVAIPEDLAVLRTMVQISHALLHATYFDEVLEAVADQACAALGASSVSISRVSPDTQTLRTLINAGELAPGEQRWPNDDDYAVSADPASTSLVAHGQPYLHARDDAGLSPEIATYLAQAGVESEVAVPIMFDGTMWGQIRAGGTAGRVFGPDDVQLLQAIAAYTAVGIGRGELFSTVWRHAHSDPLTGLPNRRALQACFAEIDWQTTTAVLLLGDMDGFKDVNDTDGHPAGDMLLRRVADILGACIAAEKGAVAARLGGDEFAVLLPHGTLADAQRCARRVNGELSRRFGAHVTMTWGAAAARPQVNSSAALLAAADGALLRAKTHGRGRFATDAVAMYNPAHPGSRRATTPPALAGSFIDHVAAQVDRACPLPVLDALEIVALQTQRACAAAGWAVSVTDSTDTQLITHHSADSVRDLASGLSVITPEVLTGPFLLQDYTATAQAMRTGSALIAGLDLPGSDSAETALLDALGYRAVLAAGATHAGTGYLVEVFSTTDHAAFLEYASSLHILVHFAISAAHTSMSAAAH
ncbi:hypothetical protein BH10ACT9_BH10ACT9_46020 [soil metagenome]